MTPTGTNLLGLVKHLGSQEYGKLSDALRRPATEQLACVADGTIDHYGDMWATPDESTEYIVSYYHRACTHADETIEALDLDAPGANASTTLGAMLVNMVGETQRHAGHADI